MWIWSSSNCWISYCNHNYGKKTKDTNHIRKFPINESKEQKEIFLLLQKDDIDGFISFLSKNPTFDITKKQNLKEKDITGISLIILIFHSLISVISLVHWSVLNIFC